MRTEGEGASRLYWQIDSGPKGEDAKKGIRTHTRCQKLISKLFGFTAKISEKPHAITHQQLKQFLLRNPALPFATPDVVKKMGKKERTREFENIQNTVKALGDLLSNGKIPNKTDMTAAICRLLGFDEETSKTISTSLKSGGTVSLEKDIFPLFFDNRHKITPGSPLALAFKAYLDEPSSKENRDKFSEIFNSLTNASLQERSLPKINLPPLLRGEAMDQQVEVFTNSLNRSQQHAHISTFSNTSGDVLTRVKTSHSTDTYNLQDIKKLARAFEQNHDAAAFMKLGRETQLLVLLAMDPVHANTKTLRQDLWQALQNDDGQTQRADLPPLTNTYQRYLCDIGRIDLLPSGRVPDK